MKFKALVLGLLLLVGATANSQTISKPFNNFTEANGLLFTGKVINLVGDSVKVFLDGQWRGAIGLDNLVIDTLGLAFVTGNGEVTLSVSKHPSKIAPRFVDSVGTSVRMGYLDWTDFDGQTVYFTYKMSAAAVANRYDFEFAIYATKLDSDLH